MIRFLMSLIPPWGWLAAAAVFIATLTGWHLWTVRQALVEGRTEVQAKWDADTKAREALAARDLIRRTEANKEATNAYRTQAAQAAQAASAAEHSARLGRAESDGLRGELAARDRASAEAGRIADEAASVALELFGECRARRVEVARAAGDLAAQVAGLQDYAERVCVAR